MTTRPAPDTAARRQHRSVLWVALLLMVACALANDVRFEACVGECCAVHDGVAAQVEVLDEGSGCCCCDDDRPTPPTDRNRGSCAPDCCVAFDFAVEMAPADPADSWQLPCLPQPRWARAFGCPPPALRKPKARHRYDRGPPRVDRRVALRATVQLLI